jgi:CDP-diacylglycerol---glycerol-3-phosphate 3-phosphatidyltransferase
MFPLNVPNVLTVVRILLVPVVIVALAGDTRSGDVLAAIVFALASLTDALDGYIARARKSVTTFGTIMDPLADKLLVIGALVVLVDRQDLAGWVAMVIIARELAVTALRSAAGQQGVVLAASWLGKVKTSMQVAMVILVIAVPGTPLWLELFIYATVLVTVVSGADYFFGLRRRIAQARAQRARELARRDEAASRG